MRSLNAKPHLMKQANLSLVRRTIKALGSATRREIAERTGISSTTVRSLLAELLENGELEAMGCDASSGGRKAQRYRFRPDRSYGAALCISDGQIRAALVNGSGEILETSVLEVEEDGGLKQAVLAYLDRLSAGQQLKAIGVGVPGIVEGGSFWRKSGPEGRLHRTDLGDMMARRYGVPVVLENDLNAAAIGFGRRYQKEFPQEDPAHTDMAYLNFEKGCVSAGFLSGGRIVRGCRNFAGELGLVSPDGDRLLDDCLAAPLDDREYVRLVVQTVSWVCAVLNPQYVALGGPELREHCLAAISDGLFSLLPRHMFAEVLHAPDLWGDYLEGMAWLTAEKMFAGVQVVANSAAGPL